VPNARALHSLAPPELNGIIQRLALFEPPGTIARGYKVPISVIEAVAEAESDRIRALRTSWDKWINRVEPLTNRSNAIVFLGNMVRRAASEGEFAAALKIWERLDAVYTEAASPTVTDTLVLDMLERADFEHARRMAQEADTIDDERLLPEPSYAEYVRIPEAKAIEEAANFGIPSLEEES
jgi:hypothetical protein